MRAAKWGLHVDFNYHWFSRVRIHIPVATNPAVSFHCGAETLHMAAGECWLFDSWRRHKVVNASAEERIHLVIDTSGSARFWAMVREAEQAGAQATAEAERLVPFAVDSQVPLRLERYSASPVMAPGECSALVEDLIADFPGESGEQSTIGKRLRRLAARLRPGLAAAMAASRRRAGRARPLPAADRRDPRPGCTRIGARSPPPATASASTRSSPSAC